MTYAEWCKTKCEWCTKGWPISPDGDRLHFHVPETPVKGKVLPWETHICTAPSRNQFEQELQTTINQNLALWDADVKDKEARIKELEFHMNQTDLQRIARISELERENALLEEFGDEAHIERLNLRRENAELRKDKARLIDALGMIYDKWENGDSCYENPEDFEGYMGKAFQLSYEEENEILGLLPPNAAMQSAGEQKNG